MIAVSVRARSMPPKSISRSSSEKISSSFRGGLGRPRWSVIPKCSSKGWWE